MADYVVVAVHLLRGCNPGTMNSVWSVRSFSSGVHA